MNAPLTYKPKEVAAMLGISTMTVYRLIKRGDIQALKVGSAYRIPRVWLDAYLKEAAS